MRLTSSPRFALLLSTLATTLACSSAPSETETPADTGSSDVPQSDAPFGDDTGSPFATDSGSPSSDTGPETPSCIPSSSGDEPDDGFKDTNCDGIDGNKTKAVFVSPEGKDEASGAFGSPVKTIGKALVLAAAGKLDVYACNATYAEVVKIESPVRIFGGFDCTTWKRGIDRADIAPSAGIPLTISKVDGVVLDRISVRAPDGSKPGESSIGILVADSKSISLRNTLVEAGAGADGSFTEGPVWPKAATSGGDGTAYTPVDCFISTGAAFSPASCRTQAPGGKTTPPPGWTCENRGGGGGLGGLYVTKYPGKGWTAGEAGEGGVTGTPPLADGSAVAGATGSVGYSGASSKSGFGVLSATGYNASNGGGGGGPGGSGAGGSGGPGGTGGRFPGDFSTQYFSGGGGGEGGSGGCGGLEGKGGGGGGASFAIVSWNSQLNIERTTLTSHAGGRGGASGPGGEGQPGGAGGKGGRGNHPTDATVGVGGAGGAGGKGGRGGAGGAGGGGPSATIAFKGSPPLTTDVTFNLGAGGKGGRGITGLTDDGADGLSGEKLDPTTGTTK